MVTPMLEELIELCVDDGEDLTLQPLAHQENVIFIRIVDTTE